MLLHERIKELRKVTGLSQSSFGERLSVSRDIINNIENGRVEPKQLFLDRLCDVYRVSAEWLSEGIGSMFAETDNTAFNAFANEYNLNDITRAAILALAKLPEDNRAILISAIRSIAAACDVVDDRANYADEDAIAHETRIAPGIIERELAKKGIS